ncbi:Eaa1 [Klebsiella pneumoniae]|nr:Eaa1 [Klebsiella pneumoniae]
MTKSTITRERLQEIAEDGFLKHGESKELARMALAAMDSVPVAVIDLANLDYLLSGADADVWPPEREEMGDVLLYRHAQLASASPVCTCPSGNGSLRWPCPVHPGNSPAIPDGYVMAPKVPTDEMISSGIAAHYERSQIQIHDRPAPGPMECAYVAMLAAAPHDTPALNSVQSVATVPGKWIPVSERMPEDEQEVLTINKIGHRFVSFFDKHSGLFFDRLDAPAACCIEHVLVTHWMPLPAAPQEVGDA